MCLDYRARIKLTVESKCPISRIDDIVDRLQEAKHFKSLDLQSGYENNSNERYGYTKYLYLYPLRVIRVLGDAILANQCPKYFSCSDEQCFHKILVRLCHGIYR
jgi:hypothetical protein